MASEEVKYLRSIAKKLDLLIAINRLSNKSSLDAFKKELKNDKVASKILELADGSISYSALAKRVSEETGAAEITVKKRVSDMKENGILTPIRRGKEVYYENSGLLE